jgi:hypothetical protein
MTNKAQLGNANPLTSDSGYGARSPGQDHDRNVGSCSVLRRARLVTLIVVAMALMASGCTGERATGPEQPAGRTGLTRRRPTGAAEQEYQ